MRGNRRVTWGPLLGSMLVTLGVVATLAALDGGWLAGGEGYGFGLLGLFLILLAWFVSRAAVAHYDRIIRHLPRFLRFGLVGGINTAVDLATINTLLLLFPPGDAHPYYFPLFATAGFAAATLTSYVLNKRWTFRARGVATRTALPQFYLVTTASFLINVGLSSLLVWLHPFPSLGPVLWANVAKVLATACSLLLNFAGYSRFVFGERSRSSL